MINIKNLIEKRNLPADGREFILFFLHRFPRWALHIISWLLVFAFMMSLHFFSGPGRSESMPIEFIYKACVQFVLLVGLFYFNAYYAIPNLLFRKKLGRYFFVLLLALLAFYLINGWYSSRYFQPAFQRSFQKNFPSNGQRLNEATRESNRRFDNRFNSEDSTFRAPSELRNGPTMRDQGGMGSTRRMHRNFEPRFLDPFALLSAFLILGISTSLMMTFKWFKDEEAQKNLEKERLSSELSFLKNQINPHFFFNTLNNIYALTEINPALAQEAIYNLSKLMRYMLYETENNQVLLSKEVEFINNYVELMRLRLSDTVLVQFTHPAQLGNVLIAPLVFVSFIENAFKHGVSYQENSYVIAHLEVRENVLHFSVKNPLITSGKVANLEGSGIGMVNVRRRLNLLYPNRHQLQIDTDNNEYTVHLTIQLT